MAPPRLSVLVPVHNGAASLPELRRRLGKALRGLPDWELVCVDDASADGSPALLRAWARSSRGRVRVLCLDRNLGQHAALLRGLALCRGSAIATLDDDLQHPPEALPALLRALVPGVDLVYGVGDGSEQPSRARRWAGRLARDLLARWVPGLHPRFGAFRVLRGELGRRAARVRASSPSVDGALAVCGARARAMTLRLQPRAHGRSGYSWARLLAYGLGLAWAYGLRRPAPPEAA